jgi:phosphatidylglycerol---prolipoprotein diacylglyceryl transferase
MHPIIVTVLGWSLPSFGLMLALAFVSACYWTARRAKRPLTADYAIEATAVMMLGALLGARILYVVFFPAVFWANPIGTLLNPGGLVWYGGMVGGILAVLAYTRWRRLPFLQLADAMTPPTALGLALGRVGCFLSGCCYGAPSQLPWAVVYPVGHITHPLHVHPSPLYEALTALLIMAWLLWLERTGKATAGSLLGWFMVLYGVARFGLEGLRGDRLAWLNTMGLTLSASQVISLGGGMAGLVLLLCLVTKVKLKACRTIISKQ